MNPPTSASDTLVPHHGHPCCPDARAHFRHHAMHPAPGVIPNAVRDLLFLLPATPASHADTALIELSSRGVQCSEPILAESSTSSRASPSSSSSPPTLRPKRSKKPPHPRQRSSKPA